MKLRGVMTPASITLQIEAGRSMNTNNLWTGYILSEWVYEYYINDKLCMKWIGEWILSKSATSDMLIKYRLEMRIRWAMQPACIILKTYAAESMTINNICSIIHVKWITYRHQIVISVKPFYCNSNTKCLEFEFFKKAQFLGLEELLLTNFVTTS